MEKVLITGISGGQGRLLTRRLLESHEVCGVDKVAWEGRPRGVNVHVVDLRKKKFEDVIRTELPTAIVHMGFVRHFRSDEAVRHEVNVRGTKQLLDHCTHYGVQKLVVLSSGYVYGAFVITGLDERRKAFFPDGTPRLIDFSIDLLRVDQDTPA